MLAKYQEVEMLVQIGEYKQGADPEADEAIAKINDLNAFLRQGLDEFTGFEATLQNMLEVIA